METVYRKKKIRALEKLVVKLRPSLSVYNRHQESFVNNMEVLNDWRLTKCLSWVAVKSQIGCNFWFVFLKCSAQMGSLWVTPGRSSSRYSQISTPAQLRALVFLLELTFSSVRRMIYQLRSPRNLQYCSAQSPREALLCPGPHSRSFCFFFVSAIRQQEGLGQWHSPNGRERFMKSWIDLWWIYFWKITT